MVPRREGKREEKTEGAGHRRRKEAVVPRQEGKREEKPEGLGTGEEKKPWCPTRRRMKNFRCSKKQGAVWHPALFLFTVQMLLTVLQKWYLHSAFSYHRSPLIRHHRSSDRYREAGRPRFSEPFRSLS